MNGFLIEGAQREKPLLASKEGWFLPFSKHCNERSILQQWKAKTIRSRLRPSEFNQKVVPLLMKGDCHEIGRS